MADIAAFLQQHIYLALIVGSYAEGESSAVLGGIAAHQAYASYPAVFAIVAAVSASWDNAMFALGRWQGVRLVRRWPALGRRIEAALPLLHRYRHLAVPFIRFAYGMRTAGPIALGMSGMASAEFLLLSVLSALAWALVYTGVGYLFGQAVTLFLADLAQYQLLAGAAVIGAVLLVLLVRRARRG
ncbi:MAG: DedA family protein [Lautropia sp.]